MKEKKVVNLSAKLKYSKEEGQAFSKVTHLATVKGPARSILLGERTALNVLTRVSSIATVTDKAVKVNLTCIVWTLNYPSNVV